MSGPTRATRGVWAHCAARRPWTGTALMWAAGKGDVTMLQVLMAKKGKGSLETPDEHGCTAVYWVRPVHAWQLAHGSPGRRRRGKGSSRP